MGKATIIEAQNSNTVYEEGKSKGILGKLKGIFADYKHGTRNADRLYTEELWDNRVFGSEDVMEALETKTLFGELDHPEGDRCETLAKNAAITITKLEKRPEEGVIYGEAEILDTPTGRIVKALADSGAKLGISSRGMGEEIYQEGKNIIDPETYDFITFDVVVTPANTKARVALTESKHISKLTESLQKEIDEAETANQLNQIKTVAECTSISNKEDVLNLIETKLRKVNNIKINDKLTEANRQIALDLIKKKYTETKAQLDESLEANTALAEENTKLIEENNYYKDSKDLLKSKLKEAKCSVTDEVSKLQEELEQAKAEINKLNEEKLEEAKRHEDNLNKLKEVQTRKIEQLNKIHQEEIEKLEEAKTLSEDKFNRLLESNKELSKNIESSSKILIENQELKQKVESLEADKQNNAKKLTESKQAEARKVLELEKQIKELTESKAKMEEAENRFSKLAFNPIGTVKAVAENFGTGDYSQDEIDLFKALTNQ